MEFQRKLAEYNTKNERRLEMFKAAITAGQSALDSAILINAGVAVGTLAFAGSIWEKRLAARTVTHPLAAIGAFAAGASLAAVASGLTHLAQVAYAEEREKAGNRRNTAVISRVVGRLCSVSR